MQKPNAGLLDLSKEEVVKMRRQIWTNYTNLNDYGDSLEKFLVTYGFAVKIIHESSTKEISFSDDQKHHIINVDKTNLSLDGSDGGCGGLSCMYHSYEALQLTRNSSKQDQHI
jgi:hypothetical protein